MRGGARVALGCVLVAALGVFSTHSAGSELLVRQVPVTPTAEQALLTAGVASLVSVDGVHVSPSTLKELPAEPLNTNGYGPVEAYVTATDLDYAHACFVYEGRQPGTSAFVWPACFVFTSPDGVNWSVPQGSPLCSPPLSTTSLRGWQDASGCPVLHYLP